MRALLDERVADQAASRHAIYNGRHMSKVETIEGEIQELSPKELAELRDWFANFGADAWDRQLEADAKAGKLDALAERAMQEHLAGRSTRL